jgi:hypothetical protein
VYEAILDLARSVPRADACTAFVPETWASVAGATGLPALQAVGGAPAGDPSDELERVLTQA